MLSVYDHKAEMVWTLKMTSLKIKHLFPHNLPFVCIRKNNRNGFHFTVQLTKDEKRSAKIPGLRCGSSDKDLKLILTHHDNLLPHFI